MTKRAIVCYCVDVDGCAGWINTKNGQQANCSDVSRGVFGANEGTNRLLKLFADNDIKATWFMPSHSILSFPTQMAKVRDAGHEIGLHGYTHEFVSLLSEEKERIIMAKSIEVYKEFTGKAPSGWAAPAWEVSPHSMTILEDFGLLYDHSLMHHDCQPYWAADVGPAGAVVTDYSKHPEDWMKPMQKQKQCNIVELPANWNVDDWPPMHFSIRNPGAQGYNNPRDIQQQWEDQFSYYYREYDSFVFCVSMHPQVSGRSNILTMQERFIAFLKSHEGVEFMPCEAAAAEFREGKVKGVSFEMGV